MNSPDPWDPIVIDPSGSVIWPRAYYARAFYSEVPSWPTPSGETRSLFDGAFVAGAPVERYRGHTGDAMTYDRIGLTAEVAPVLAPATGPVAVRKAIDGKVLHVEICVDGKCYSTSMDLAPAVDLIMDQLAQWHRGQHAQMTPTTVSGAVAASTVNATMNEATDGMVAALIGRHLECACGGWLSDIGHAVKSAASGVEHGVAHGVSFTIKKLKGPIGAAAAAAATAAVAAIPGVGPVAAPLAGKLANSLVQAAAGDSSAKKQVAQAAQLAKTDPTVAVALDAATKAAANSAVAHHVQDVAMKAADGHPEAQAKIAQVVADARGGDHAAKAVMDLVSNAFGGSAPIAPPVSSGWYDLVGAAIDGVRTHAQTLARAHADGVVGVIRTAHGAWKVLGFRDADSADDWLGAVTRDPSSYTYAAIYDKADILWPHPLNEKVGVAHAHPVAGCHASVGAGMGGGPRRR